MPGVKIFWRRWEISSDDFVFPEITEGCMRLLWALIILAVYLSSSTMSCSLESRNLHTWIIVCFCNNVIVAILAFVTAYISSRGTVRNAVPRRNLHKCLYARVPLGIFEILWLIVGTSWSFQPVLPDCFDPLVTLSRVTAVIGWFLLFTCLGGFWLIFDPLGHLGSGEVRMTTQIKRLWQRRLHVACCCIVGTDDNAKSAYQDVAELMSVFFLGADLVLSDIWAGLLLLANQDFQPLRDCVTHTVAASASASQRLADGDVIKPPPDWMNMTLANRMMEFSLAIYGWPYYVCDSLRAKGLCALWRELHIITSCQCNAVLVVEDNCCMCNTAAFRLTTGLPETDLFHVSFHNHVYEVPFVAAFDLSSQSIVITVRGSMSMRDAVTDLCANEESLNLGLAELQDVRVHKGILKSAQYVFDKLESEKILYDMFILHPDYYLVITGHSLGAGVAAVLTLLLRRQYPSVRCFAFSPPGCVISENALSLTQECILSVVLGDDMVPRMSLQSMQKLKDELAHALDNCDRPKYDILIKGCFKLLCRRDTGFGSSPLVQPVDAEANSDQIWSPNLDRDSAAASNVNQPLLRGQSTVTQYHSIDSDLSGMAAELFCPGRIIHIIRHPNSSYFWKAKWLPADTLRYLKLSSWMVYDHMPYNVAAALRFMKASAIETS